MADEAFALSPIAARPSLPSEADYDAIREAFMETARGRWFLNEYTKRNRNADTTMVLDAVTRIEQTIAAQKQPPASGLADSLDAIRALIHEARLSVAMVIAGIGDSEELAAALEGARMIREVAWTLRECGADTRICDLMDDQLAAIDAGHRQIQAVDAEAIDAAFDLLAHRIADLADDHASMRGAPAPFEATAPPTPAPRQDAQSPAGEPPQAQAFDGSASGIPDAPIGHAEPVNVATEIEQQASGDAAMPSDAAEPDQDHAVFVDLDSEQGVAMLDLVAMEMSAPDLDEPEFAQLQEIDPDFAAPADCELPDIAAGAAIELPETIPAIEPVADPKPIAAAAAAFTPAAASAAPPPASQPSLGAALLASGVVARPATGSDPLAPIRRMSQAEKIALFS